MFSKPKKITHQADEDIYSTFDLNWYKVVANLGTNLLEPRDIDLYMNKQGTRLAFDTNLNLTLTKKAPGRVSGTDYDLFVYYYNGPLNSFELSLGEVVNYVCSQNPQKCNLNNRVAILFPDGFHHRLRAKAYSGSDYLGFDEIAIHYDTDGDADNDQLPDWWENLYGLSPTDNGEPPDGKPNNGPTGDPDQDGLSNLEEFNQGCIDPLSMDTDADGLSDPWEIEYDFDPCNLDIDGDGLSDGEEVLIYYTDPFEADSDQDGLNDYDEVIIYFTDPWDKDSDDDSLFDGRDNDRYEICLSPNDPDSDDDLIWDGYEVLYDLNPCDPLDATLDYDGDGLSNIQEFQYQTDPYLADTDDDGLSDYEEVFGTHTNPTNPDTNGNGILDGYEGLADCFDIH